MPHPLRAGDVVAGFLTENTPRMLTQAIRLLRSIRWFGGDLASVRVVVGGVGPLESGARDTLERLGAEIRVVSRFHPGSPAGNRLQLIAELLDAPQDVLFVLDCDTIVVRDPLPYLGGDVFEAKITPTPTVSDDVFERLFAHFELPKPPRSHVTPFSGTPTIPYFNTGVIAIPRMLMRTLAPSWRKYNQILADDPHLVSPCERHLHQAALALALAETGIPVRELPAAMNYQINAPHVAPPPGYAEIDPVIVHYHHLATEDGFLLPTPYPGAQARMEMFHDRMRAEGLVPAQERAGESRPIVVLGMHRSGTSVVAHLLNALGVYAGRPDELNPPDLFNPTGYWEHIEAMRIDRDLLDELGASWIDIGRADVSRLTDEQRARFVARAKSVGRSLRGHGPFLLKDPRMSLLFPIWREALGDPLCVIVRRDPMAVAKSLAKRDNLPPTVSVAAWKHTNETILRETAGLTRMFVSYEELMADPVRVARELCAFVPGAEMVSEERIRQIVNPDFNRSGTGDRRALANQRIEEHLEDEATKRALRRELAERDELLRAVFASRSWRIGHALTGLWRWLRRGKTVTAEDRWRKLERR